MSVNIYNGLPKYKSHKIVAARQIDGFDTNKDGSVMLTLKDEDIHTKNGSSASVEVDLEWMEKHSPCSGGYLVAYEDGYLSYCPQRQFEKGNTLLSDLEPANPIDAAINAIASKLYKNIVPNEIMALSQAALNLAHAKEKLAGMNK